MLAPSQPLDPVSPSFSLFCSSRLKLHSHRARRLTQGLKEAVHIIELLQRLMVGRKTPLQTAKQRLSRGTGRATFSMARQDTVHHRSYIKHHRSTGHGESSQEQAAHIKSFIREGNPLAQIKGADLTILTITRHFGMNHGRKGFWKPPTHYFRRLLGRVKVCAYPPVI